MHGGQDGTGSAPPTLPSAAQLDRLVELQLKEAEHNSAAAAHFEQAAAAPPPETAQGLVLAMLQRSIFLKEQARAQLALHEGAVRLWSKVGFDLETSARARDDDGGPD